MNFKKDKYTVINEAYIAASNTVNDYMRYYDTTSVKDVPMVIENAMAMGIKAAVESIVHNMYTNEDLEKDLDL